MLNQEFRYSTAECKIRFFYSSKNPNKMNDILLPGIIHGTNGDGWKLYFFDGLLHDWCDNRLVLPGFKALVDDEGGWANAKQHNCPPNDSATKNDS